jgi:hypothetical protein
MQALSCSISWPLTAAPSTWLSRRWTRYSFRRRRHCGVIIAGQFKSRWPMSRLVRRPRTMGCPLIGQSHVDGGIIVGQAHNAETEPFRRRCRARRLGIEFRRGANWVLPGEMFVNSMRWAISAPYDNILCERCWILPLTLDFQRARSEYLPRCHHPHL